MAELIGLQCLRIKCYGGILRIRIFGFLKRRKPVYQLSNNALGIKLFNI